MRQRTMRKRTAQVQEECEMSLLGFIVLLIIAAIAGALGQAIAGYSLGGFLVSIVVGLIGALIGWWLAGAAGLARTLRRQR